MKYFTLFICISYFVLISSIPAQNTEQEKRAILFGLIKKGFEKKHLNDDKMIELFKSHEKEFSQLLNMAKTDPSLFMIEPKGKPTTTDPKGMSTEKIEQYQKLLSAIGLEQLRVYRTSNGYGPTDKYEFFLTIRGAIMTGDAKGYIYTDHLPKPIVSNLDEYKNPTEDHYSAYRPISEDWYLFYDYN